MALFEFLAFWRDGVTAKELGQTLAMSREAAQRSVVGPYKREFPNNSMILHQGRTHVEGDAYALKASPYRPLDVANFTSAIDAFALAMSTQSPLGVPIEDVASPIESAEEVSGLRALYGATAHRRAVYLDYLAKRRRIQLVFSPHTMVRTPMRIHFRGHSIRVSGDESRYIDVVPGRIIGSTPGKTREYIGPANDMEWHQRTRIVAELNRSLPEDVRAAVKQEYDCGDSLEIKRIRQAVAPYIVDWLTARRLRGIPGPIWEPVEVVEMKDG